MPAAAGREVGLRRRPTSVSRFRPGRRGLRVPLGGTPLRHSDRVALERGLSSKWWRGQGRRWRVCGCWTAEARALPGVPGCRTVTSSRVWLRDHLFTVGIGASPPGRKGRRGPGRSLRRPPAALADARENSPLLIVAGMVRSGAARRRARAARPPAPRSSRRRSRCRAPTSSQSRSCGSSSSAWNPAAQAASNTRRRSGPPVGASPVPFFREGPGSAVLDAYPGPR